jgi:hypothetical protein
MDAVFALSYSRPVAANMPIARRVLAAITALLLLGIALFVVVQHFSTPALTVLPDLPFNDQVQMAVDLRIGQSNNLFQLVLLIAAALLGVFLARSAEAPIGLADKPELVMSICTGLLLIASVVFHVGYVSEVQQALVDAGTMSSTTIPDVLSQSVEYLFYAQLMCVAGGVLGAGLALFSTYRLREG